MSDNAENLASSNASQTALVMIAGRGLRALQYVDINGRARVEGCIDLGKTSEVQAATEEFRNNSSAVKAGTFEKKGAAINGLRFRWTDRTVPFTIDPTLPDPGRVDEAIAAWRAAVPRISFVPRKKETNFVTFQPGDGCSSSVGMQGGQQFVTLGDACTTGNCIHEIGHTLGLWHEQSRIDRDLFARVLLQNVIPGTEHNFFQHIDDGIDLGTYDYASIMHYPANAFSRNGKPTIEPVTAHDIGQRDHLSPGDIKAIEALYP